MDDRHLGGSFTPEGMIMAQIPRRQKSRLTWLGRLPLMGLSGALEWAPDRAME